MRKPGGSQNQARSMVKRKQLEIRPLVARSLSAA
jgi:hypothetical protein